MDTQQPFVITISRELGSGGHTVGQILAERLDVRYSDKDLIAALRERFNLTTYAIEELKGKKKNWLSDFIQLVAPVPRANLMDLRPKYTQEFRPEVITDDIYYAEAEILTGIAAEGACVIAGRSGFFILRNLPNKLDVFITASFENRVNRVVKKQGYTREQAAALIEKVDEMRENYVKRYTGRSRYDSRNYDLVLNADGHTEDELADIILRYIG